mmetsp:Transcript_15193/g.44463  ORF Transcript_15193/g.44463 Transcript_15193/m.44463 type:complete len:398 (+) Transcript_15193:345-1538(+)
MGPRRAASCGPDGSHGVEDHGSEGPVHREAVHLRDEAQLAHARAGRRLAGEAVGVAEELHHISAEEAGLALLRGALGLQEGNLRLRHGAQLAAEVLHDPEGERLLLGDVRLVEQDRRALWEVVKEINGPLRLSGQSRRRGRVSVAMLFKIVQESADRPATGVVVPRALQGGARGGGGRGAHGEACTHVRLGRPREHVFQRLVHAEAQAAHAQHTRGAQRHKKVRAGHEVREGGEGELGARAAEVRDAGGEFGGAAELAQRRVDGRPVEERLLLALEHARRLPHRRQQEGRRIQELGHGGEHLALERVREQTHACGGHEIDRRGARVGNVLQGKVKQRPKRSGRCGSAARESVLGHAGLNSQARLLDDGPRRIRCVPGEDVGTGPARSRVDDHTSGRV